MRRLLIKMAGHDGCRRWWDYRDNQEKPEFYASVGSLS
mgnify:CR=1 FL=1